MTATLNWLTAACLTLYLAGCSKPPLVKVETVEVVKPAYVALPDELARDCPVPAWRGTTAADLADYALELIGVIHGCNADKAAIRELQTTNRSQ